MGYNILTDPSDILESGKPSAHNSSAVVETCTEDQA